FVDVLRLPERRGEHDPVQLRVSELPVANYVADESLAVPSVRITVEVTGTTVITVAALNVLRLHVPIRGQIARLRPRPRIRTAVYNRNFRATRGQVEMDSYFRHSYPSLRWRSEERR